MLQNRLFWIFVAGTLVSLTLLTYFAISGSSVGIYYRMFYGNRPDPNLIWGQPRQIRSDEWLVATTYTASQAKIGYPVRNALLSDGQVMALIYDAPVKHWSTLFKPYNWAFFFLPFDNAFALKWWWRGLFLLICVALFFKTFLSKNGLAWTAALAVTLSPFVQWWYSGITLEIVAFGSLAGFASARILRAKQLKNGLGYAVLLWYSLICFTFMLYPPFQIAVGMFVSLIVLVSNFRFLSYKKVGLILVSLAAVLATLFIYYQDFSAGITAITQTVYPGRRLVDGGGYGIQRLLSGVYNIQLTNDGNRVPTFLMNQSEAASFFLYGVLVLPLVLLYLIKKYRTRDGHYYILVGLTQFLGLTITWNLIGLPSPIAHVLLLDRVPTNRLMLGIGLADIALCWYLLDRKILAPLLSKGQTLLYALGAGLIIGLIGLHLRESYPAYLYSAFKIFGISSLSVVIIYSLIRGYTKIAIGLIIGWSFLSVFTVNPLYKGTKALIDNQLLNIVTSLQRTDPAGRWAVYETNVMSNYLLANGFPTVTGVYFYPQDSIWHVLDPDQKYQSIYNRYAHVTFTQSSDDVIAFKLISPDAFWVSVKPCHPALHMIKVKYYLFPTEVHQPCLTNLAAIKYPAQSFYMYEDNTLTK